MRVSYPFSAPSVKQNPGTTPKNPLIEREQLPGDGRLTLSHSNHGHGLAEHPEDCMVDVFGFVDGCFQADDDRLLGLWHPVAAVGAADEGGIERNHLQQATEAEFFLQQELVDPEIWRG